MKRLFLPPLLSLLLISGCDALLNPPAAPAPTPAPASAPASSAPPQTGAEESQADIPAQIPSVEANLEPGTLAVLPLTPREDILLSMVAGTCRYFQFDTGGAFSSCRLWVEAYRDGQLLPPQHPELTQSLAFPTGNLMLQTSNVNSPLWTLSCASVGGDAANWSVEVFDPCLAMFGVDGLVATANGSYEDMTADLGCLALRWSGDTPPAALEAGKEIVLYAEAYGEAALTPEEADLAWGADKLPPEAGQYVFSSNSQLLQSPELLKKFEFTLFVKCSFS